MWSNAPSLISKKYFCLLSRSYGSVRTHKTSVLELNNVLRSSVQLVSLNRGETMYKVSAHELAPYYRLQLVPQTPWTALIKWFTRGNLTYTKILQKFSFTNTDYCKIKIILFLQRRFSTRKIKSAQKIKISLWKSTWWSG